jgi:hypothetical protein
MRFAMKISSSFFSSLHRKLPLLLFTHWLAQAPMTFAQGAFTEPTGAKPQIARSYGAEVEKNLIREFEVAWGMMPFANLRH